MDLQSRQPASSWVHFSREKRNMCGYKKRFPREFHPGALSEQTKCIGSGLSGATELTFLHRRLPWFVTWARAFSESSEVRGSGREASAFLRVLLIIHPTGRLVKRDNTGSKKG